MTASGLSVARSAAEHGINPKTSSVLDDTPIAAGIRYALNQRVGLAQFLEDGQLPIHNNASELALRREAIGRKNWLFVGSDDGGVVNATFTTLLASAQLCVLLLTPPLLKEGGLEALKMRLAVE